MKNLLWVLAASCLFFACEGYVGGEGLAYDALTNLPIAGVKVEDSRGNNYETTTDSLGHFSTMNLQGCGCNGCEDVTITLSKDGYHTLEIENPEIDTLFLQPK